MTEEEQLALILKDLYDAGMPKVRCGVWVDPEGNYDWTLPPDVTEEPGKVTKITVGIARWIIQGAAMEWWVADTKRTFRHCTQFTNAYQVEVKDARGIWIQYSGVTFLDAVASYFEKTS